MSELFCLFYGHQRASKWDLCRRAASHYIAFLATSYLRKAFDLTKDKSNDKKFILKVLIRDYNVRISEVKLGRNYQVKIQDLMQGLEAPVNKLLLKEKLDATYKVVFIELSEELEENPQLADVLSPPTRRIKSAFFVSSSKLHPMTTEIEESIMDHFYQQSVNTSFERPISKIHKRLRYIQKLTFMVCYPVFRNWNATKRYLAALHPEMDHDDPDSEEKCTTPRLESHSKMFHVKDLGHEDKEVTHTDSEFLTETH